MIIDVTYLVTDYDCSLFASSVYESGRENIGQITWTNAMQHVAVESLVTAADQDELREWLAGFGAWDREEVYAMSDQETNALLLQFIAGTIRAMERYDSYDEYMTQVEAGCEPGNLWRNEDGTWAFDTAM